MATPTIEQNGYTEIPFVGFMGNYYSGTFNYSDSEKCYVITAKSGSNFWGSGININYAILPYGIGYRFSAEVHVPSAHAIQIDINNIPTTGSEWSGNDNDYGRSNVHFSITENTWTPISWYTFNTHPDNTNHASLYVYDGIGLVTTNDSTDVTWKLRNPKMEWFYTGQKNRCSTGSLKTFANNFKEY